MIVKEIDLFKGIDPKIMEEIVNICSEENYTKDTALFKKGDVPDYLYILLNKLGYLSGNKAQQGLHKVREYF